MSGTGQPVSKVGQAEQRAARMGGLAKWAQQHIADTERKVAELEARVAALSQGPAESDTVVDGLGTYPDRELGLGVSIGFRLPDGSLIRARVRDSWLELNALGPGQRSDGIVSQPSSGNVLRVRSDRFW
jgi:hypothetical protein